MPSQQERIYFIGGTGGVGSKAVQDVLAQDIPITIYTRQPEKSNYKDQPNVKLVQGDYDDLTPFEKSISGHTRLFLLVGDLRIMARIKGSLAKIAYAAGVKQIVDISSCTINVCPHTFIGQAHLHSEEAIRAASSQNGNSAYVSIRPWRFMSNHIWEQRTINAHGAVVSPTPFDTLQAWISPNDIGALAAIALTEPIEKHDGAIYPMVGELLSGNDRARILSKVFNRPVEYKQCTMQERYDVMSKTRDAPHKMVYDLAQDTQPDHNYSPGLSLVLGREPESL